MATSSETTETEKDMKGIDKTALLKGREAKEKRANAVAGIKDPDLKRPDLTRKPARLAA